MLSPDSASSPLLLALTLLALVALLVVRALRKDRLEYRRFKRYRSSHLRQRMYRKWLVDSALVFGGSAAVTLALAWQYVPLLLADVDSTPWIAAARAAFSGTGALGVGIATGVVVALVGGSALAIFAARHSEEVPSIGDIQSLLPRTRAELRWGAALSVNAGIVEELLFRLAVPAMIYGLSGNAIVAIAGSLLLFGALHAYQGVAGIIGSTVIGAALMVVFLATGSIVAAIVAHALIDLRSLVLIPVVVYRVHRYTGNIVGAGMVRTAPTPPDPTATPTSPPTDLRAHLE